MGDNSVVAATGQGRVQFEDGSFENFLHIPRLFVNLLLVYQMTHTGSRRKVEFTTDSVRIYDMQTNLKIALRKVNDQSHMYTFSDFVPQLDSIFLLTHANEESRIWHERFGHLNFRYMQQLSKQGMVKGLSTIEFSNGACNGCALGKHPQDKFEKGHAWRASSPLELLHSDLMGPFLVL